jgi:hypothetical protein
MKSLERKEYTGINNNNTLLNLKLYAISNKKLYFEGHKLTFASYGHGLR